MKFEELKNSLKQKIDCVYLLEGEEGFFRERGEQLIKKAAVTEPDLNYARLDVSLFSKMPEVLVNALECCPFMSERRMITVNEWYPTAQDLKAKALKKYFDEPFEQAVLVVSNSKKCDALKKLQSVTFVDCAKGDEALITRYIRAQATKANLIISTSVCQKIIEYCLYDMTRIDGEVSKLISYCDGQDEITLDAVEKMVTKTSDYKIYEMVQFIADKNYGSAYKILEELGDSPERQVLFTSVYYHFRRLFFSAVSNASDYELAQELGVKEFAVTMARRQAKLFTAKRLKKIMDKLAECDSSFKSGKMNFDGAFMTAMFTVLTEE